jgi:Tfp pilus assembly protein PilN
VLVAIVLAVLIAPIVILEMDASSEIDPLEDTLRLRNAELSELYGKQAEATALEAQIDAADNKLNRMEQDYDTFRENLVLWSEIIEEIDNLLPAAITLTSITAAADSGITLVGNTEDLATAYKYTLDLEDSDYFSDATIEYRDCPDTEDKCGFTINIVLSGAGGL